MSPMASGALELVAAMAIYTVFATADALGIPRDQLPAGLTGHIGAGRSQRNATPLRFASGHNGQRQWFLARQPGRPLCLPLRDLRNLLVGERLTCSDQAAEIVEIGEVAAARSDPLCLRDEFGRDECFHSTLDRSVLDAECFGQGGH